MNFLLRYGNFLLFLILELFSLFLVSQYNKKQNEIYQSSANLFVGTIYNNFSNIRRYFSIQEIADSLAKENADLKTQLEASKYVATDQKGTVLFPLDTSTIRPDTSQRKDVIQQFDYIAAKVIKNSIMREDNYLTINRGSDQGVKPGMGVISSKGIVGVVKNVTPRFSQVISVLNNRLFSTSAMIKRNRFFGSLKWHSEGEKNTHDPRYMVLEEIPKHGDVIQGDTIISTGFSEIFPGGIQIGTVKSIRIVNGNNFYTLEVELWENLASIEYVYVVNNLMLKEFNDLYYEPVKEIKKSKKAKTQ